MDSLRPLENRTALVTGSSSGLGERFARVLAGAGARVIMAARRLDRLAEIERSIIETGERACSIALDVSDAGSIDAAIDAGESLLGPIDVLVNNAGISVARQLGDYSEADYDAIMNTNTRGAFFVAQAVGRRMILRARSDQRCSGRIINIASAAGLKPLSQLGVYAMSKAAVIQMTRAMALEWGRLGLNVNAICPGYIETDINRGHWNTDAGRKLLQRLPRRRLGEAGDLDGLLLLLASEGSDFINGAIITADDGLTAA